MYKIGDFSKLTGLSVKTLRYYDSINLLNPSYIDKYTSYRYYTDDEYKIYKEIEYLKKLGFTLEEIKNNINNVNQDLLNNKKEELILKRDYIINQIDELDLLINNINKPKIKKYNNK